MASSQRSVSPTAESEELDFVVERIANEHQGKYKVIFSGTDPSTNRPWEPQWHDVQVVEEEYPELVAKWKAKSKRAAEADRAAAQRKQDKKKRKRADEEDEERSVGRAGSRRTVSRSATDRDTPVEQDPKPKKSRKRLPDTSSPPPAPAPTNHKHARIASESQSQGQKLSDGSSTKRTVIPDSQNGQEDSQSSGQRATQTVSTEDSSHILPASVTAAKKPRPSVPVPLEFRPGAGPAPREVVEISSSNPARNLANPEEDPISDFSSPEKASAAPQRRAFQQPQRRPGHATVQIGAPPPPPAAAIPAPHSSHRDQPHQSTANGLADPAALPDPVDDEAEDLSLVEKGVDSVMVDGDAVGSVEQAGPETQAQWQAVAASQRDEQRLSTVDEDSSFPLPSQPTGQMQLQPTQSFSAASSSMPARATVDQDSYDAMREANFAAMTQASTLAAKPLEESGDTTELPSSSTTPPMPQVQSVDRGAATLAEIDAMSEEPKLARVVELVQNADEVGQTDKDQIVLFLADPAAYARRTDAHLTRRPVHLFPLQSGDDAVLALCIGFDSVTGPVWEVRGFSWEEYAAIEAEPATQTQALNGAGSRPAPFEGRLSPLEEASRSASPEAEITLGLVGEDEAAVDTSSGRLPVHAEMQTEYDEVPLDEASLFDLYLARAEIVRWKSTHAATAALYRGALDQASAQQSASNVDYDLRNEIKHLKREVEKLATERDRLARSKNNLENDMGYLQQKCQAAEIDQTGLRGRVLELEDELATTKKQLTSGLKQVHLMYGQREQTVRADLRLTRAELALAKETILRTEKARVRAGQADEEKRLREKKEAEFFVTLAAAQEAREHAEGKAREFAMENGKLATQLRVAKVTIEGLERREETLRKELAGNADGSGEEESEGEGAGSVRATPQSSAVDGVVVDAEPVAPAPLPARIDLSQPPMTQQEVDIIEEARGEMASRGVTL